MKKILIIGSKGMAGHVIYSYFKNKREYEVIDISRNDTFFPSDHTCDATDTNQITEIIQKEKPDIVINCIGLLNDEAEKHPDKAVFINSYFPHFLAAQGSENKFKLLHISTDCVFNGKKGSYRENDLKDGYGFYATSKALGEVEYDNHLTIRTSIIGPELKNDGIGLLHWFLTQKGEINGFDQAFWSGVTTLELAKSIDYFINNNIQGLVHLTNNSRISKYELLNTAKKIFNREKLIIHKDSYKKVDKSLISTREEINYEVPDYDIMLEELNNYMQKYPGFYKKYDSEVS